jgi:DNA polymerase III alpha subunit
MPTFSHLHVHTQYSLLDGAASVEKLYDKAIENNMPALAITDHGNMFGAFEFVSQAWKKTKIVGKDENGKDILASGWLRILCGRRPSHQNIYQRSKRQKIPPGITCKK